MQVLHELGLGYLTLGEETPSLSGGEAQRLKLASEMGKGQSDTIFVFDEPTIGLHPLDVRTLLNVFQNLIEKGATVIVIEQKIMLLCEFAERLAVLDQGAVVLQGSARDVLSHADELLALGVNCPRVTSLSRLLSGSRPCTRGNKAAARCC